jgi:hypothetical protein
VQQQVLVGLLNLEQERMPSAKIPADLLSTCVPSLVGREECHRREGGLAEGTTIGPALNRLPDVLCLSLGQSLCTLTESSHKQKLRCRFIPLLSSHFSLPISLLHSSLPLQPFAQANNCVTLKRDLALEKHSAHQEMSEISSLLTIHYISCFVFRTVSVGNMRNGL